MTGIFSPLFEDRREHNLPTYNMLDVARVPDSPAIENWESSFIHIGKSNIHTRHCIPADYYDLFCCPTRGTLFVDKVINGVAKFPLFAPGPIELSAGVANLNFPASDKALYAFQEQGIEYNQFISPPK